MRKGWQVVGAALAASWIALGLAAAAGKPTQWTKESGLTEPKLVERVAPSYPEEARKEKVKGSVVIEATIETDGKVSATRAVEDPDARLTAAALEAVAKWRFEPARNAQGKPVAVIFTVTVNFKMS